jgi:outer membrane protein TolC
MSRQSLSHGIVWLVALLTATVGCQPQKPFYFLDDGDFSHYIDVASDLEVPDLELESLDEVNGTLPPLTLDNAEPDSVEDLTLEQAVRNALENAKIMRDLGGVAFGPNGAQGNPSTLLSNPAGVSTVWDPALVESDPRFGVEGALAAFDTQFTTSMFWEKNDSPVNVGVFGGQIFSRVNQQDLGTFQTRLLKTNATGGTTSITHNVRYEQSNSPLRSFPSDYGTNIELEFRQPFGQGAGVQYNRISGPGAIPGFNAGVMIARLRVDTSLNDFEAGVRNLVGDVERAYWNLYYAYRFLDTVRAGRDSGLQTWLEVQARTRVGARRGGAQEEAQARQQLWAFQAELENAQSNLFKTESFLRYTMGLAPSDGRLFRPSDKPSTARVRFDWYEIHAEALTRSLELRKQRWAVKQRELELISSKNYLLPRVDMVGRYRWLGLGDKLVDSSNSQSNAYGSMTSGDFQEWQLGVEVGIPLGFRKEMAGVRNAQLALARSRGVLQEQELELVHQLGDTIRELDRTYQVSQTHFNGRVAASKDLEAANAKREAEVEGATLTLVLDAQRRLALVERDYFRSLVDYNLAITAVHLRKGSLLEYNGVYLAEGPWPGKAYFDAERRAQARDASFYLDYGFTRPKVISRGAYGQHAGREDVLFESGIDLPVELGPEILPTPDPVPLESVPADPPQPRNSDQSDMRTPRSPEGGPRLSSKAGTKTGWTKSLSPGSGPYDMAKHLDILAGGSLSGQAEPAADVSPVKPAGYVQSKPSAAAGSAKTGNWKSPANSGKANEIRESSPPAKNNTSSPGWKRAKRRGAG